MDTLRSDMHYYFIDKGFEFLGNATYIKGNIKIEYDDFYTQIFKYYEDNKLIHLLQDDFNFEKIKNILRGIKIDEILDGR